jgi:hypothetical protein
MPMHVPKLVPRDRAEPEEERRVRLLHVGIEELPRLEANVLDDIGWVNPTLESRVETEVHHRAQPQSVPLHQLRPAHGVARGSLLHQLINVA